MEVIGELLPRTKVKRRKACTAGKLALSNCAPNPSEPLHVVATGRQLSLLFLPREICRAPRKR